MDRLELDQPNLGFLMPIFSRLNANGLRVKLVTIGARPPFHAPWIEHRPWQLETERAELAGFDIGIMPMPDNESS